MTKETTTSEYSQAQDKNLRQHFVSIFVEGYAVQKNSRKARHLGSLAAINVSSRIVGSLKKREAHNVQTAAKVRAWQAGTAD